MRKPTASERRLLMIFALMIFAIANLVIFKWYSASREKLSGQVFQLEQTASEYRALLDERPRWEARRQWMQNHPLAPHQGPASDSRFAEEMQRLLTQAGLGIDAQQIRESSREGDLVESQLEFTIKGRLDQVIRWLNHIQQPGNHVVVQSFTLRRLDEGEAMLVRVRIGKIFRVAEIAQTP